MAEIFTKFRPESAKNPTQNIKPYLEQIHKFFSSYTVKNSSPTTFSTSSKKLLPLDTCAKPPNKPHITFYLIVPFEKGCKAKPFGKIDKHL